jgi:hypothetical protein
VSSAGSGPPNPSRISDPPAPSERVISTSITATYYLRQP